MSAVERKFAINLVSHFRTIQAFVPDMLRNKNGGTIVTIASVLGAIGPQNLSDYAATKAGVIAMHSSLGAELRVTEGSSIQTILVKSGQLDSPMFSSVKPPNNFLGPIVRTSHLASTIVSKIESGRSGIIAMPLYTNLIEIISILPYSWQRGMRWASGVDSAMCEFQTNRNP